MAIYKPSNFYPHLQEIDLTNIDGNIFSCQVNTDGSMVSGARLTISSEDNILVYDNLYQLLDGDGEKDPVQNKEFIELMVQPYNVDSIINFGTKKELMVDEDGNPVYDDNGNQEMIDVSDCTKLILKDINFITLTPYVKYDIRKDYCPFNIYNVKLKDSYCFGLKFVNKTSETDIKLMPFKNVEYEKVNDLYNIIITYEVPLEENILNDYNCYIILLNDKDYVWDVKLYEHLFSEDIDKGSLVTDGYITGSTKSVLWWDNDKQSNNTLFNRKEIKEDYFVEVVADKNNSDLFEEQIKMGRVSEGILTANNVEEYSDCFKFTENIIDADMYDINNLFLKVDFINEKPKNNKIKSQNYFKIKKIYKKEDSTHIMLEDLDIQNLIFDFLHNPPKKYCRKVKEIDGLYTYYDEYGESKKKIYFSNEDEANAITSIISKNSTDDNIIELTENIETEIIIDAIVKYSIVYKQREQITWVTENLGFDKNINKIEVKNDFNVNLKDGTSVDVYGGDNVNTNYSFFGVRDSNINVNDIYVRFPGYIGLDFNGESVNDNQKYYEEKGDAPEVYDSNGNLVEFSSEIGLQGYFYQEGNYCDSNDKQKTATWGKNSFQPIDMYGKNVPSSRFAEIKASDIYGYIDYFNIKNKGTSYCNKGFIIELYNCWEVKINGDISYSSCIPNISYDEDEGRYGLLCFYIDEDNEWSMCALQRTWLISGSVGYDDNFYSPPTWGFPKYPKPISTWYDYYTNGDAYRTPDAEEQIENKYKIGKIKNIQIEFGNQKEIEQDDPYIKISYYNIFDGNKNILDVLENWIKAGDFSYKSNKKVDETNFKTLIEEFEDYNEGNEEEKEEGIANLIEIKYSKDMSLSGSRNYTYLYPGLMQNKDSYCKLFKVTSYDYETGEFIIAGGLARSILNTDQYEVWQRVASETSNNEYNITEIDYLYTRIYPPHDKYDDVAYVGDTKVLNDGVVIMNNTNSQIFIQPNVNFYSDDYNTPYLILDNYNEKIEFPYTYKVYDDGFTIQDTTINTLDGSQWLLKYSSSSKMIPKSGYTYKLYMDNCKSTPANWFYGRNIANLTMRVGEYNFVKKQLDKGIVKSIDFSEFKKDFNDITIKKVGKNCLIQCIDAYFMVTYDQLSVPIKRYRYKLYDSTMKLINDSGYIYDNKTSYGIKGFRNEELYFISFEMEDQLGYVYNYEEKIIVKYVEYDTNLIQLQLTNNESQGCIIGDFVTLDEASEDIISERDTYDEDGHIIKKGELIKQGTIYARLCRDSDFINKLSLDLLDDILIYRRNKEKLLSFVCKINLLNDQIYTGREYNEHRYGFIDYGVYNNEYYDYVAILKQKDLTTDSHLGNMEYTYSENRCKTSFNGWILMDIEKNNLEENYYVSDLVWNFRYNLESQDLTQNTSVTKWETLGKYPNVNVGQKNYISSGLTCLLGDVGTYYTYNGENIIEKFGYFEQSFNQINNEDIFNIFNTDVLTNNVDKYLEWKDFNNNGNPKLLKDYKGNIWIVQILENPTVKNSDVSQEQVYTISFSWVEIMNWRAFPILGKPVSFDRDLANKNEIDEILSTWEYLYSDGDVFYNLTKIKDNYNSDNDGNSDNPLYVQGRVSLDATSMTGILNECYEGEILLEKDKKFISSKSDLELKEFYDNQDSFISPFKIKQTGDIYEYPSSLTHVYFEQSLLYENNSIDFMFCGMSNLQKVNIILTDNIKTARYAFAGTSISTDEQYKIIINTNNYINTYGIFDDLQGDGKVVVTWGSLSEDPDLKMYAELYEQYWNDDKIVLDCVYNFNKNDWNIGSGAIDENGIVDGVEYSKKIILYNYIGNLTSVYIPKFYKDVNGEIYLIELSETFNI